MKDIIKKRSAFKFVSMILTVVLIFAFLSPCNAMAAKATKLKLKGVYWDHQVKTANKSSKVVKCGNTYKITLNLDKRHPGSYNGMVKFTLPKFGKYNITMTKLSGASYVGHILYKKYKYGIDYASYFNGQHNDLVTQDYYNAQAYKNASSLENDKVGKAVSQAILESGHTHYLYFLSDGKATFTFKISKAK